MIRERIVKVKKYTGKRETEDKIYTWEYYALNLSIYIPQFWIEKFGENYKMTINYKDGTITIKPMSN